MGNLTDKEPQATNDVRERELIPPSNEFITYLSNIQAPALKSYIHTQATQDRLSRRGRRRNK